MSLSGLYVFQPRGLQRLELGPWGLRLWVNDQWYYVILYVRISTSTIKRGLPRPLRISGCTQALSPTRLRVWACLEQVLPLPGTMPGRLAWVKR